MKSSSGETVELLELLLTHKNLKSVVLLQPRVTRKELKSLQQNQLPKLTSPRKLKKKKSEKKKFMMSNRFVEEKFPV
jgi:hypothetical protein